MCQLALSHRATVVYRFVKLIGPHYSLGALLLSLSLVLPSCEDECEEPDPRGEGLEGEICDTTRDCVAGLACIGTDFEASALCTPDDQLPGGADPGCLAHPDDWTEHEAHGVQPSPPDDHGCEQLIFVSGCNCEDMGGDGGCVPVQPFYRQEVWRSCSGCCWRLVKLWDAPTSCETE